MAILTPETGSSEGSIGVLPVEGSAIHGEAAAQLLSLGRGGSGRQDTRDRRVGHDRHQTPLAELELQALESLDRFERQLAWIVELHVLVRSKSERRCRHPGFQWLQCRRKSFPSLTARRAFKAAMPSELYQRLKPLYDAALDAPKQQRAQFVDEACRDQPELRGHLEALLAAHDESTGPLDDSPVSLRNFSPSRHRTLADGEDVLGRFKIVRILGVGGMGEVYEAEDRLLRGVHVALKTILPDGAGDPELQRRFEREVLLAREVTHPNLCPIHEIFHCDDPPPGYLFLTMKLLPGQTLAARLQQPPDLTNEEGLAILHQASLGIAAIHAAGIIHRDIKPTNIMVDGSGAGLRLWITDFGLAHAYETESTVSSTGMVAGTRGYIAPELFLGHPPSQASDLFAIGVVLHEVFAGEKPTPVPGTHSYTVSPRLATRKVPALGVRLITECLQNDLQRRCAAFARTLEVIEPKLAHNYYARQKTEPWSRRRFVGAAAAGICAIAGAAWWKRERVEEIAENIFEPLPEKRYVALLAWPAGHSQAVVLTVLDSIGRRLARAEATVKNLLIIKGNDLPSGAATLTTPAASVSALGANLVLAASLQSTPSRVWLTLQVLEATTQRILRTARVSCSPAELSAISDKASQVAARILGLPDREIVVKDTDELQRVSPEVFRTFSEAEQLANKPNGSGLDAAVQYYQQALDMDPHFALAYARLSMAYTRQYLVNHEPAKLRLAQSNTSLALRYNPSSAMGLLSQAMVFLYSGDATKALDYFSRSLKADPGNPETLLYKGQALRNVGEWPKQRRSTGMSPWNGPTIGRRTTNSAGSFTGRRSISNLPRSSARRPRLRQRLRCLSQISGPSICILANAPKRSTLRSAASA